MKLHANVSNVKKRVLISNKQIFTVLFNNKYYYQLYNTHKRVELVRFFLEVGTSLKHLVFFKIIERVHIFRFHIVKSRYIYNHKL